MKNVYLEGKRKMRDMRWILFWVMLTQLVMAILMSAITSFMSHGTHIYLTTFFIEIFAYPIPIFLYAKTGWSGNSEKAKETFSVKNFNLYLIPLIIIMAIGGQFIQMILNLPLSYLLKGGGETIPTSIFELLSGIVVIALIPAVFEEFLMRGIVYGVMKKYSTFAAVVFTTVMFALLHANLSGLVGYVFLGFVLTIVLRRTGSIFATIIFHFVNNVTALVLEFFSGELGYTPVLTIWLFVGGIIAFLVSLLLFKFVTKKPEEVGKSESSTILGQSFLCLT
ncbi:MAG: type II CAAX endopeptidase family protein, partial [Oscillospiraceae bacterium]